MKTTERFDNAVRKLYTAFHEGTLDGMNCRACAVGNLLGHSNWYVFVRFQVIVTCDINNTDYSPKELYMVEKLFLYGEDYHLYHQRKPVKLRSAFTTNPYSKDFDKEAQYTGLIAVVKYLAELDGIEWPDYTKLFEYNEQGAIYDL